MTENHLFIEGVEQKEELERKLRNKTTINQKTISGEKQELEIEERLAISQSDTSKKIFVLEKMVYPSGKKEIRFGYYIIGKKGKFEDRWAWGQFAPFIPPEDLKNIIKKAEKEDFF